MGKSKKRIILVSFLLIIIMLIIGVTVWVLQKQKESNPEEILERYMACVLQKDYEQMYTLLSEESKEQTSKEDFITKNKNIYEGIEVSKLEIKITKTTKENNKAEIIYGTNMDTLAGQISFSNTANLVKDKEQQFKVNWSSTLIFPDLKKDYKIRVQTLEAIRGKILDRNEQVLAGEQTASWIGLVPGKMGENKTEDIAKIAQLLDLSTEAIDKSLKASYVKEDTFVPLKTVQKDKQELKEALLQIKGIKITDTKARVYPLGKASAQLLGYVQTISQEELEEKKTQGYTQDSQIGKAGIEKLYEERLRATDGVQIVLQDEMGKQTKILAKKNLQNGQDIQLTIDSRVQQKLYEQFQEDKSACVAMNPKTGEILALVSTPTFDSNDFSLGMTTNEWNRLLQDENKPLYNRYLASFAPGSSFKPITGAIGLSNKAFTASEDFGTSGLKWQEDTSWKDFFVTTLSTYSGPANLQNALIYSDNIYFAKAALKIGKEKFAQSLDQIGFHNRIPFEQELTQSIYSNTQTFTTQTQLANSGYGQAEMLVNPIHMAMLYSSFSNEGNMVQPYLEYKTVAKASYYKEKAFTKEAADTIKEDLIQVVENESGTAHSAKIEGLALAGKTGTAEIKSSKEDTNGTEVGWFNAFTVDENTKNPMLIISMVENVKGKGGSHYLLPKVKAVFQSIQ